MQVRFTHVRKSEMKNPSSSNHSLTHYMYMHVIGMYEDVWFTQFFLSCLESAMTHIL